MDFNPKIHDRQAPKLNSFNFGAVVNPLSEEIADTEGIRKAFKEYPLIPYAGGMESSGDSLLKFLNSARFISATQGACHEAIKTFAFGGKIGIRKKVDNQFDLGTAEPGLLNEAAKVEFLQFVKEIKLKRLTWDKLRCNLYDSLKSNGNYFVEIVHSETDGIKETSVHYHKAEHCRYFATAKGQARIIAISSRFDYDYLRKSPPAQIPVFPNYKRDAAGTLRTIVHFAAGDFEWYGRPDWIESYMSIYRQYQNSDYLAKIAGKMFTAQVYIEIEEEDIENDAAFDDDRDTADGFENTADRMERNFTSKADDPQTIMIGSRPYGAKPAFVHEFKANTNEAFYKTDNDLNRQAIIESNQWSERLLGNAVGEGFSTDSFVSELKVKEVSVLSMYRKNIDYALNVIVSEAAKFQDRRELLELSLYSMSAIDSLQNTENDDQ